MQLKPFLFATLICLAAAPAFAQHDFKKLDTWLNDNTAEMGGRSILMVYKDGQVAYSHAVNNMNMRQKMMGKFMAKRQGKTADLDDYTPSSRVAIASCSKWLSAALVMTFVDEGRLKTNRYRW